MRKAGNFWLILLFMLAGCSDQTNETATGGTTSDPVEAEVVDAVTDIAEATGRLAEKLRDDKATEQAHLTEGKAYLHINAEKPNVTVLETGLQFEILEQGDGKSPGPESNVVTHYHGTFISGEVFDSSLERGEPAEFPVNRVIKGWTQALQMMKEGDVWRIVIPPHLAYGKRGAGNTIPPDTVLVFEVELIEVKD